MGVPAWRIAPAGERLNPYGDDIAALPDAGVETRSVYLKAMDRKVWAFAIVEVAAVLRMEAARIVDGRLILTGLALIPWRVRAAEERLIAGASLDDVAEAALADAQPLAHNGYKVPLAKALIRRAVETLT